jgi:chemotaxis protein MotB
MHDHGMQDDQVTQVRGFADQSPREATKPEDPSNRRVTLIIQYQKQTPNIPPEPKPAAPSAKPAPKPPAH